MTVRNRRVNTPPFGSPPCTQAPSPHLIALLASGAPPPHNAPPAWSTHRHPTAHAGPNAHFRYHTPTGGIGPSTFRRLDRPARPVALHNAARTPLPPARKPSFKPSKLPPPPNTLWTTRTTNLGCTGSLGATRASAPCMQGVGSHSPLLPACVQRAPSPTAPVPRRSPTPRRPAGTLADSWFEGFRVYNPKS